MWNSRLVVLRLLLWIIHLIMADAYLDCMPYYLTKQNNHGGGWHHRSSWVRPDHHHPSLLTRSSSLSLLSSNGDDVSSRRDYNEDSNHNERTMNEEVDGSVSIPTGGISISDEMEDIQKDRFVTTVVPIQGLVGVAQLVTAVVERDSVEPVRYLVPLSSNNTTNYILVDIPPFSQRLYYDILEFITSTSNSSRLVAAIITNRESIHYDDAPAIYTMRRSDIRLWKQAFPDLSIIGYRLDIPRDCRHDITQILDGYGPFAYDDVITNRFMEAGRPFTYDIWDHATARDVLAGKMIPPDDCSNGKNDVSTTINSPQDNMDQQIRDNEFGKKLLAIYTPGHTFGSISFVFPDMKVACTGFTIPVEDNRRNDDDDDILDMGPAFDCRGYITTNRASFTKQMQSAGTFIDQYIDRFHIVLPALGDPLFLDEDNISLRKDTLHGIIRQYEKIGKIYEQLGIISSSSSLSSDNDNANEF